MASGYPTLAILCLVLFKAVAAAAAAEPLTVVGFSLERPLEDNRGPVIIDAGDGVSFEFGAPVPDSIGLRRLTVWDGLRVVALEEEQEGLYCNFARVSFGAIQYWVLGSYSGGAHCCAYYLIFCRPAPGQPLKYLKNVGGHNGTPRDLQSAFLVRNGRLYFQEYDNRFDYFFSSHAECLLVNFPPRYWLLTQDDVVLSNLAFKSSYLAAVPAVERELRQALARRTGKPPAILKKDYGGWMFSDAAGQLLVKRTILLLYTREDTRAWRELAAGVRKYYQTDHGLAELTRALKEHLAANPY